MAIGAAALLSGAVLAAGAPPGAMVVVLDGSAGVVGAVPEAGGGVVGILVVVPGVVFLGAGATDWATADTATPMLRLSPMVAMMSFCIVILRKFLSSLSTHASANGSAIVNRQALATKPAVP